MAQLGLHCGLPCAARARARGSCSPSPLGPLALCALTMHCVVRSVHWKLSEKLCPGTGNGVIYGFVFSMCIYSFVFSMCILF